ncbi:MAG: Ig-like domain-containing protein [Patescibacteria group bacterium]
MNTYFPRIVPLVLGFGLLLAAAPFVFAFTGSFSTFEVTPTVSAHSVALGAFSGGLDANPSTTITAGALSGGVNPVVAVLEVKASKTLTVNALPDTSKSIVIGSCTVTFTSVNGSTVDESNCNDGVASIDRTVGGGDNSRNANQVASALRGLFNVSDAGHGALTVAGGGATATFTTSGSETSATDVSYIDHTGADITSTSNTTGVIAVAGVAEVKANTTTGAFAAVTSQVGADLSLNVGGTAITLIAGNTGAQAAASVASQINADGGNPYTATVVNTDQVKLSAKATGTSGNAALVASDLAYNSAPATSATLTSDSFVAVTSAPNADLSLNIGGTPITLTAGNTAVEAATAVAAAINADGANPYSAAVVNTNQVQLTSEGTGVGMNGGVTASDLAYNAAAQIVNFTPASPTEGETFRAIINNVNTYDYTVLSGDTVKTVVEALQSLMVADPDVACSEDDVKITCTASSVSTPFSYDAQVVDITKPTVMSIDSTATGAFNAGDTIDFTVVFSEPVVVTGFPQITLDSGGTATYVSGSGSDTLTFSYTVQPTDNSADLTYSATTALTGTIQDAATPANDATLTLPPTASFAGTHDIVIDTVAPTIAEVTPVSSPTPDPTPDYTFSSDEAGTLSYGVGDCSSATAAAVASNNTVTFDTLADGTHSNCTIEVTDAAGNVSNTLAVASFDVAVPTNNAPVAVADSYVLTQNNGLAVSAPGVLGNDTDADSDPLTASLVSGPSNGILTFNADGSFVYTSGVIGTDSFVYQVSDGTDTSTATVSLTIQDPSTPITPATNNGANNGNGAPVGTIGGQTINAVIPTAPAGNGQVLGAQAFNFGSSFGFGARGTDVSELQRILIASGFLKITAPTGWFGPMTQAAVKLYQKAHGIPALGMVGPLTRAALNADANN